MKPVRSLQEFYEEDAHNPATTFGRADVHRVINAVYVGFFLRHLAKHDLALQ